MKLIKPIAYSVEDLIIDHSFGHVSGLYVLRTLLETNNWSQSFGIGGYSYDGLSWHGNTKGIDWKLKKEDQVNSGHISIREIIDRALKWVKHDSIYKNIKGTQLSLF